MIPMLVRHKNKFLVFLVLLLAVTSMSFNSYDADEPAWKAKNLEVLPADITHEQLDELMDGYNISLGVQCVYCHVKTETGWDYVSDAKREKAIARKMQIMTTDINQKYFGNTNKLFGTVTCMTCHQGGTMPR
jgi:hypothetical protein